MSAMNLLFVFSEVKVHHHDLLYSTLPKRDDNSPFWDGESRPIRVDSSRHGIGAVAEIVPEKSANTPLGFYYDTAGARGINDSGMVQAKAAGDIYHLASGGSGGQSIAAVHHVNGRIIDPVFVGRQLRMPCIGVAVVRRIARSKLYSARIDQRISVADRLRLVVCRAMIRVRQIIETVLAAVDVNGNFRKIRRVNRSART